MVAETFEGQKSDPFVEVNCLWSIRNRIASGDEGALVKGRRSYGMNYMNCMVLSDRCAGHLVQVTDVLDSWRGAKSSSSDVL